MKNFFDVDEFRKWINANPEAKKVFTTNFNEKYAIRYNPEKRAFWVFLQIPWMVETFSDMDKYEKDQEFRYMREAQTLLNDFCKEHFGKDFMSYPTERHLKINTFVFGTPPKEYKLFINDRITLMTNLASITFDIPELGYDFYELGLYPSNIYVYQNFDISKNNMSHIVGESIELTRIMNKIFSKLHEKVLPLSSSVSLDVTIDYGDYFKPMERNDD